MLKYRVPALTAVLQLVQDSEPRPSSILFYPVFDRFFTADERAQKAAADIKGSISIVFSWDDVLVNNLPQNVEGIVCVLKTTATENDTGEKQTYSFKIAGNNVTYLGKGDQHDAVYDWLKVQVIIF